jgi:hypothetical protein
LEVVRAGVGTGVEVGNGTGVGAGVGVGVGAGVDVGAGVGAGVDVGAGVGGDESEWLSDGAGEVGIDCGELKGALVGGELSACDKSFETQ